MQEQSRIVIKRKKKKKPAGIHFFSDKGMSMQILKVMCRSGFASRLS